jgi:hypothetical protein
MNNRIIEKLAEQVDLLGDFTPTKIKGRYVGYINEDQIMKFAELVWNAAYRQGIDDGWTDAMEKDSACPCGADGGTSCGDPSCMMITGENE